MTSETYGPMGRFETIHGRVVLLTPEQGGRSKGSPAQWPEVAWRPQAFVAGTSPIDDLADCSVVFDSSGAGLTNTAWFGWLHFGPTDWPRGGGVRINDLLVLREGNRTVGYFHVDAIHPSARLPAIRYQQVSWLHTTASERETAPALLYSEIIGDRETRKVEESEDGRTQWADSQHQSGDTFLSLVDMPTLDQINAQEHFEAEAIRADLFEAIWRSASGTDEPLRQIGYWAPSPLADAGTDRRIGELPDPNEWVDPSWDREAQEDVVDHLERGALRRAFMGYSPCRICGQDNGALELTDGTYAWPDGLAHYVRDHGVRLPDEFVAHVYNEWQIREARRGNLDWWRRQTPPREKA